MDFDRLREDYNNEESKNLPYEFVKVNCDKHIRKQKKILPQLDKSVLLIFLLTFLCVAIGLVLYGLSLNNYIVAWVGVSIVLFSGCIMMTRLFSCHNIYDNKWCNKLLKLDKITALPNFSVDLTSDDIKNYIKMSDLIKKKEIVIRLYADVIYDDKVLIGDVFINALFCGTKMLKAKEVVNILSLDDIVDV